jgi:hypothetical protein
MTNFIPPREVPCRRNLECKVPAQRQNILDKMSSIRANWPESDARDNMLTELQRDLAKLGDACDHESHPDDWFEDPGVGYATDAYWRKQRAKYLCYNECPIRLECLNEGFKPENMAHGTYGGLHVEERAKVVEAGLQWRAARL